MACSTTAVHLTVNQRVAGSNPATPVSSNSSKVKQMKQSIVRIEDINRPHQSVLDEGKMEYLMESIQKDGLQVPIDLLEVEGRLYGFNGCHRYNVHKRLGLETIKANIRKVDRATFRLHLM